VTTELTDADRAAFAAAPQPSWNNSATVARALEQLAQCTEADLNNVCSAMLYAVGNNHCGSYFPVALLVIPHIGKLLVGTSQPVRRATLEVLVDMLSFDPDPDHEYVERPTGNVKLRGLVWDAIEALRPSFETLRTSDDPATFQLVADILEMIAERNEPPVM